MGYWKSNFKRRREQSLSAFFYLLLETVCVVVSLPIVSSPPRRFLDEVCDFFGIGTEESSQLSRKTLARPLDLRRVRLYPFSKLQACFNP